MKRFGNILRVSLLVVLGLCLSNCSSGDGGGGIGGSSNTFIDAVLVSFPTGSTMPGNFQNAFVTVQAGQNGGNITTAIVSMNGVALSYNAAHQEYEGIVIVAPEENVTLTITDGDVTFTTSGNQFASYPPLIAPQPGNTWLSSDNSNIKWTGGPTAANEAYAVGVLDAGDPNGNLVWPANNSLATVGDIIATADFAYFIPSNTLSAGSRVALVGKVKTIAIPNASSGSSFTIGGFNYAAFTVI